MKNLNCDGDMWDWFSKRCRRVISSRPGKGKTIKKRANKRIRKEGKEICKIESTEK